VGKNFAAGGLVVALAAGIGYWLCSDKAVDPPAGTAVAVAPTPSEAQSPTPDDGQPQPIRSLTSAELIDLSRTFDPTGEELDLQQLLDGTDLTEHLPEPRLAVHHTAAGPAAFPLEVLAHQLKFWLSWKSAEVLSQSLPLKGTTAPE
jgi:hypothetical protein